MIQLLLAIDSLSLQAYGPVVIELVLLQSSLIFGKVCFRCDQGLRILEISLCLENCALEKLRIDLGDDLALRHFGIEIHVQLVNHPGNLRSYLNRSDRIDCSGGLDDLADVSLPYFCREVLGVRLLAEAERGKNTGNDHNGEQPNPTGLIGPKVLLGIRWPEIAEAQGSSDNSSLLN